MQGKEYIYGLHAVRAFLLKCPHRIQVLIYQSNREDIRVQEILQLAKQYNLNIRKFPKDELTKLLGQDSHQGIIAEVEMAVTYHENDLYTLLDQLQEEPFLLILDGVQDPHNLGACLRSADAAGVHAVIVPKDNAVGLTPIVRKVASGAAEVVPLVQVTNLARTMQDLQQRGIWLMGAAEEAHQSLYQVNLTGPLGLVMGAEGKGLRRLTKEYCDDLLRIPMKGFVSSLNVSVATGIFLFEVVRQRQ